MSFVLREFYLPVHFISVIIGLELAGYFLYQYHKLKVQKIELDKFLLGFGIFFGVSFIGYLFFVIRRFYVADLLYQELFLRLTYMLIISSLIVFGFIISSKPFRKLINPKISYPITIIMFIPFIGLVFLDPSSTIFRLSLAPVFVGVPLIIIFQYKLIRLSSKNLKRRMILILLGEMLAFGAIILGADIPQALFYRQFYEVLYTIAIPIFLAGLFIIFLGIYKFPVFLELNWYKNLDFLFIIDNKSPKQLYIYDFKEKSIDAEQGKDKSGVQNIFSKGLIGIDGIIAAVTDTASSKIEKIEQGEKFILVEQGQGPMDFITYALLVKEESSSARYFLKEVKRQFEGFFKDLLLNMNFLQGSEDLFFSSFDVIMVNLITK